MKKYYFFKLIAIKAEAPSHSDQERFGVSPEALRNVQALLSEGSSNTCSILSLDGGGVRGLVEAVLLQELAKRLPKPLYYYFDLIAGTSIGSVIACSVSMDRDIDEWTSTFIKRSGEIFPSLLSMVASKLRRTPLNLLGPPLYDGKGLESLLQDTFGESLFTYAHLRTPVLIPAYSLSEARPVYIVSDDAGFSKHHVWEICRAACSAPYFFPPFTLKDGKSDQVMIDGALFSNSPVGSALAHARRIHRRQGIHPVKYLVSSFGTVSKSAHTDIDLNFGKGNVLGWIRWLLYTIFDSNTKDTNLRIQQSIGDDNFFRFQVELPRGRDRIDNSSPKNLQHLIETAREYALLPEITALLDKLAKRLISIRTVDGVSP